MFEPVGARYDGPEIEKRILDFWRRENVFGRLMAEGAARPQFVFYEGPPTANGRPGIHHVLARTFKDLFPRYKTMRGFHCPRKAGWDTHGLPVEHEVEKELGIFDKKRIEQEVGIASFTAQCRASVMRHVAEWEAMTERMGFWVDFKDAYFTLHNDYIESVWQLLKQLWDKKLLYQGYKVVPYDPRIGATLSSHEVAQGYREVEDPSVYVRFRVQGEPNTSFLVWTTTPWTLPSNLLLAVHPDVEYAWVKRGGETLILALELVPAVLKDEPHEIVRTALGRELDGMRYERLFDYLPVTRRRVPRAAGGVRHDRRRHGHRAHRAGLRRGRPEARPAPRIAGAARRGRGRLLPAGREARRRQVLQGRRPRHHRDPARARPAVPRAEVSAQLSVRLAHGRSADLLRQERVVHPHDGLSAAHGRAEPDDQVGAGAHPRGSVRQLAREQHRLGAVARAVLGHAVAAVDRRQGRLRLHRLGRGARAACGAQARRSRLASARHRRRNVQARRPRVPARDRGHRLLVRFGRHAVRAVALSVRESRDVREELPGRLHLRGHRPDPWLVLHAARDRDDGRAIRPPTGT